MSPQIDFDKLFCSVGRKYGFPKLYLKSIATVESGLNPNAYRYEPAFWEKYLKHHEFWKNEDPKVVSASYGLMQIMFVTAYEAGFPGKADELYNPVYNVEIGAKILHRHYEKVERDGVHIKFGLWPMRIITARYNGGTGGNPGPDGSLRNQAYVDKVFSTWAALWQKEKECE